MIPRDLICTRETKAFLGNLLVGFVHGEKRRRPRTLLRTTPHPASFWDNAMSQKTLFLAGTRSRLYILAQSCSAVHTVANLTSSCKGFTLQEQLSPTSAVPDGQVQPYSSPECNKKGERNCMLKTAGTNAYITPASIIDFEMSGRLPLLTTYAILAMLPANSLLGAARPTQPHVLEADANLISTMPPPAFPLSKYALGRSYPTTMDEQSLVSCGDSKWSSAFPEP